MTSQGHGFAAVASNKKANFVLLKGWLILQHSWDGLVHLIVVNMYVTSCMNDSLISTQCKPGCTALKTGLVYFQFSLCSF